MDLDAHIRKQALVNFPLAGNLRLLRDWLFALDNGAAERAIRPLATGCTSAAMAG